MIDLSLTELIGMAVRKAQRDAWDSGWQAHSWQHQKQDADPAHSITRENPFA